MTNRRAKQREGKEEERDEKEMDMAMKLCLVIVGVVRQAVSIEG